MSTLAYPHNEKERIEVLKRYDILDTPPNGAFDRITSLAAAVFNVPVAIISLVDTDRIWFKSHYGLSVNQIGRDAGLCASAILANDVYVVDDASKDPRTLTNPLVAGEFGLKFYAAAPLQTAEQCNMGTFCIIDKVPRTLTDQEQEILKQLAQIVMDEMENRLVLRKTVSDVKKLSSDISNHLSDTIKEIETTSGQMQKEQVIEHLDASRMFLINIENRLDQF